MSISNVQLILKTLIEYKDPISGQDLIKLTGLTKSNIHSSIHALTQKGCIIKKEDTTKANPALPGRAPVSYQYFSGSSDPKKQHTPLPSSKQKQHTSLSTRCYHYLKARQITTTSYQVSDFFDISLDQAAALMQSTVSQHTDLLLTVSVRVIESSHD